MASRSLSFVCVCSSWHILTATVNVVLSKLSNFIWLLNLEKTGSLVVRVRVCMCLSFVPYVSMCWACFSHIHMPADLLTFTQPKSKHMHTLIHKIPTLLLIHTHTHIHSWRWVFRMKTENSRFCVNWKVKRNKVIEVLFNGQATYNVMYSKWQFIRTIRTSITKLFGKVASHIVWAMSVHLMWVLFWFSAAAANVVVVVDKCGQLIAGDKNLSMSDFKTPNA